MRFILIDRITHWHPGQFAEATKSVALSEDFFDDHFPLRPIMPGVLILEGVAELSGLLLEETVRQAHNRDVKAMLVMVEKAKFRSVVTPGDSLVYRATIESYNEQGGKMKGIVLRANQHIGESKLVFTLHEIDNPRLDSRRAELLAYLLGEHNE
ncbi:3-hydroxyacyl-ACP dehydratase FabZ family protein [candidate division CSSED10-310 bacterium]|uniref:3-hydroxyacyl-ACP dehydratase FabZ family protein n=1 Tax=candidate division CSSED10-310 bacterium TaxID=2855610 RepID=A0ABV6YUQ8_UNCC1